MRFVAAFNAVIDSKDNILEDCRLMQTTPTDCTGIDAEIESLLEEIDVVTELTKRCIAENSQTAQNQEEYAAGTMGLWNGTKKPRHSLNSSAPQKRHGKHRRKPSEFLCLRYKPSGSRNLVV